MANDFSLKGFAIQTDYYNYQLDINCRETVGNVIIMPVYNTTTTTVWVDGVQYTVKLAKIYVILDTKNVSQSSPFYYCLIKRNGADPYYSNHDISGTNANKHCRYYNISTLYVRLEDGEIVTDISISNISAGSNIVFLNDESITTEDGAFQAARDYFDEHPINTRPPGKGSVDSTLDILKDGQRLYLYSQKYKKTYHYFVDGDIDIDLKIPDWEIVWVWNFNGITGVMMVDSNFNGVSTINDWDEELKGSHFRLLKDKHLLYAKRDIYISRGSTSSYLTNLTEVKKGKKVPLPGNGGFIIARKNEDVKIPYETALHWLVGGSMEGCIIGENEETFTNWNNISNGGEYILLSNLYYSHRPAFAAQYADGYSKYYNYNTSNKQKYWGDKPATDTSTTNGQCFIAFAIPE